jgi:hypothetical protein
MHFRAADSVIFPGTTQATAAQRTVAVMGVPKSAQTLFGYRYLGKDVSSHEKHNNYIYRKHQITYICIVLQQNLHDGRLPMRCSHM